MPATRAELPDHSSSCLLYQLQEQNYPILSGHAYFTSHKSRTTTSWCLMSIYHDAMGYDYLPWQPAKFPFFSLIATCLGYSVCCTWVLPQSHSHKLSASPHCGCRRIWGQFQHSNECNLPRLIATDLSPQNKHSTCVEGFASKSTSLSLYCYTVACDKQVGHPGLFHVACWDVLIGWNCFRWWAAQTPTCTALTQDHTENWHAETARVQSLGHFTLYLNTVHRNRGIVPLVLTCHCWAKLAQWKWTTKTKKNADW